MRRRSSRERGLPPRPGYAPRRPALRAGAAGAAPARPGRAAGHGLRRAEFRCATPRARPGTRRARRRRAAGGAGRGAGGRLRRRRGDGARGRRGRA
ncbi:RNA helicase, partial [Dankookia rubra]